MNLNTRWEFRQLILSALLAPLSLTGFILAWIGIRAYKLQELGIAGMFPEYRWPKMMSIPDTLHAFWSLGVTPLLWWIPVALVLDLTLRRYVFKLT